MKTLRNTILALLLMLTAAQAGSWDDLSSFGNLEGPVGDYARAQIATGSKRIGEPMAVYNARVQRTQLKAANQWTGADEVAYVAYVNAIMAQVAAQAQADAIRDLADAVRNARR